MGPVTPPPPGSPWECLELCPLQVEQSELQNLFEKYVPYLIDVIVEGIVDGRQGEKLKMIVPQTNLNMVTQLTKVLDALLEGEIEDPDLLECFFLEALYCSLGACLLDFGRNRFDECIKRLASLPSAELDEVWARPGELPGAAPPRARGPTQRPAPCWQVFEILLSRGYSENNFREDLKNLYLRLGIENKTTIFLFTDAQVVEEGFLELINNMLTSGIVPALFAEDEKETILGQIDQEALKQGVSPAKESVWQYFVNKSANNLHIVLGMSPVGDALRTWCRNFPGLVNNTGIDWFMPWPPQALHAVAKSFLGPNTMIPEEHIEDLVEHVVLVHGSVGEFSKQFLQKLRRSNYVTPKNYLDFINTYSKLLDEKTQNNIAQCKRLEGGLDKLKEASIQLDELNRKLAEQKIVLAEKSTACETLLEEIVTNTAIAEEKKKLAEEKAMDIEEQNKIIAVEKAEAETALAEVMPILEAAKLELQKLDKSDVTEIRYRAGPPPAGLVPSVIPESSAVVVAERARPTERMVFVCRGGKGWSSCRGGKGAPGGAVAGPRPPAGGEQRRWP
ncbi:Dynein heavy chain 10, axonemal [Myotis davidii]|uniref:Dynein heavy chain 10, axonemal n=1 Tax=Myotis davidii TaxID=225400 RepID=L5LLS2_MYODS|nr:Dynein heavy chain 10, axonemal [Myotis davidii]